MKDSPFSLVTSAAFHQTELLEIVLYKDRVTLEVEWLACFNLGVEHGE